MYFENLQVNKLLNEFIYQKIVERHETLRSEKMRFLFVIRVYKLFAYIEHNYPKEETSYICSLYVFSIFMTIRGEKK